MRKLLIGLLMVIVTLVMTSCKVDTDEQQAQQKEISEFIGQWVIEDETGGVSWLEVRQEENYLDADLLWRSGSVLPVSDVYLAKSEYLIVTRTGETVLQRDENNNPLRSHIITRWLEVRVDGENMSGYYLQPRRNGQGIDSVLFTGNKLPPVPEAPDLSSLNFGEPVALFNGTDLSGWVLIDTSQTNGFSVVDGNLVNNPVQAEGGPRIRYGNIRTQQEFEDFNLKIDINVPEGSNSGIYLRGMYEIQVMDSHGMPLDPHNMGAVYSRITPSVSAEKPAGTWQSMDITLCNRHITVVLNGITIIDNRPVYGPTGGAMKADVFAPGPIYLQGDHGMISYRNIVLTPILK